MAWPVTIPGGSTWYAVDFEPFTYPVSFPAIIEEFVTYAESSEAVIKAGEAAASATAAAASEAAATTKAGEANTSATTATTQAGISTTKAGEAATSATTAMTQAGIATTQAGIATAGAGTATSQAALSTAQAVISTAAKDAALVAQAAAAASATGALTSEANAAAYSASASASATLAAASAGVAGSGPAVTLLYPALSKLLATAADVVDVFVYDVRNDSDGGRWTMQCEGTSWYQETLNVASFRGARREFPKVAAIVLRSGTTTPIAIYDLTDLDGTGLPRMWMMFAGSTFATVFPATSVFAINGRVYVTLNSSNTDGRFVEINFPLDQMSRANDVARAPSAPAGIVKRSVAVAGALVSSGAMVAPACNHVHARVLPGAQIDAAGLAIPTVLVSTAAGASVVHPNGSVCDITTTDPIGQAMFTTASEIAISAANGTFIYTGPVPYADIARTSWSTRTYSATTFPAIPIRATPPGSTRMVPGAFGGQNLALVDLDSANPANGMVAHAGINFATGWQAGDIRLASLCDGTTGNITGSAELVVNGDFPTDLSGWTVNLNGGTGSVVQSGGAAVITGDGTNLSSLEQSFTTVIGQTYQLTMTLATNGGTFLLGSTQGNNNLLSASPVIGTNIFQFTAATTTSWLRFIRAATSSFSIDNVSVKLAVADRSYKGKGLVVNGTLARTAVATGAEVVAFGGFSASNYLEQPYSADQDYGTADFFAMAWHKSTDPTAAGELIARASAGYTGPRFRLSQSATGFVASVHDGTTAAVATGTSTSAGTGIWQHVAMVKRGTVLELWVNGVKEATTSVASVGTLTNATATLRMGLKQDGAALNLGSLALARLGAYAPSPAQMARIVRDEAPLFEANAKAFLGGTSNAVAALSRDESRNILLVGTADGVSEFSGLRRTNYLDTASVPGSVLANDNMKAVSGAGGFVVMAGAAQAIAYRPARNGIDEMNLYGRPPPREKLVPKGVTTDATPLNLSPRIPVGEREFVFVDAVVVAKQEGVAATEAAVYPIRAAFKRDAGGNITLITVAAEQKWAGWNTVGPAAMTSQYETTSTMEAVFVVDTASQTIAIQATGKAATRLIWEVNILPSSYRVSQETQYLPIAA